MVRIKIQTTLHYLYLYQTSTFNCLLSSSCPFTETLSNCRVVPLEPIPDHIFDQFLRSFASPHQSLHSHLSQQGPRAGSPVQLTHNLRHVFRRFLIIRQACQPFSQAC